MCVCILAGARTCVRLQMCMCVSDGVRGISSRATHDHAKSATHWGCSVQIIHVEVRIGG